MENRVLFFAIFFLLLHPLAATSHNISAVFAFGDSTLDAGNNNQLHTIARADHVPYGRELPGHLPSGRFSDGRLITDFIVSALGLKDLLPPYSEADRLDLSNIATGVSFASAGTGLDDLTASQSQVMTMAEELSNFAAYTKRLTAALGKDKAQEIIGGALFVIGAGSNDWMINYYISPIRSWTYSKTDYSRFLIGKLRSVVEEIYHRGGRKFAISGLPPLGCLPLQITLNAMVPINHATQRSCVVAQNNDAAAYNSLFKHSINALSASLVEGKFVYVDIYTPLINMIHNPKRYGFESTTLGCCGTGTVEMGPLCNAMTPVCSAPSSFMFWDSVHPSEATYKALAKEMIKDVLPKFG
ncbi:GDSL esterase/lipase At2g40250-like [Musa acuminata AAA Group]|uniref:GDSL esterase/lipase At2g40250-like n=1 Tax=Musa acuminata AAA Group TaxID=214697 RepID=UPI0031D84239